MAVAGLRGTGDWGADERPKNFREMILFRNPNGAAPIFALSARVQKESTNDAEFSWWDEPNDLLRLQVNKSGGYGAGATQIVVDSTDPTTGSPGSVWGVATHLVPGDLLLVEPVADAAVYDHEIVEVSSVVNATTFNVRRGAAGTTAATIADDSFLLKIGSAYAEGTAEPKSAVRNPIKYTNYTQIFKTVYELTGTAVETNLRTGDPVKTDKKRKSFDHARDIELSLLFGQKSEVVGDNGKPKRTMDGIRKFLGHTTILADNWSIANPATPGNSFLEAISPVFDFDTEAGDERIIFAGNNALNRLNSAVMTASGVGASSINYSGDATVFGMKFQRFILPQGTVFVRTHPLMNRHDLYKNSMFVLDFSSIRYRPMRNRDTRAKDNIQADGEDVRRGLWQTECGLEVRRGGLTCAYIGGFDKAIA